jgi:hypothetical protein
VHDELGHKGSAVVTARLYHRFWWPSLDNDVCWFIRCCHQCQVQQFMRVLILPTVQPPAALFWKAYMDTMSMPKTGRFKGIVQA